MATTTTIYSSKGTWLDGENPTTNNSSGITMQIGQQSVGFGSGERANAVFSFDVSSLTDPSAIVQANLNLTTSISMGNGDSVREIYAYRLNQDFVEDEVTWEEAEDGVDWSGGDDVGAASNSEITQYSLSARRRLESYCDVGWRVTTEPDLDITELVKDAVNRRSGTLLLWVGIPLSDTVTTSGYVLVHSPQAVLESNRPKIDVTIADRIEWVGGVNGNLDNTLNWSGGAPIQPTADDVVIFSGRSDVAVTTGDLSCNKLYIAKSYRKDIGVTWASRIDVTAKEIRINKKHGRFYINCDDGNPTVWITNNSADIDGSILSGEYVPIISKTRSEICLKEISAVTVIAMSGTQVRCEESNKILSFGSRITTEDGTDSGSVFANKSRYKNLATQLDDITVHNSTINLAGDGIDGELTFYSGTLNTNNNSSAEITIGECSLFGGATINGRNDARTLILEGDIVSYGGKILLDSGYTMAIS